MWKAARLIGGERCHPMGRVGIERLRHQQEGGWGDRALLHGHMLAPHSGWISALVVLKFNTAVAVLMLLVALFFTGIAVLGIVMLKRVRGCVNVGPGERAHVPRGLVGTFRRNLGGPG